jgi:hypothetical protein
MQNHHVMNQRRRLGIYEFTSSKNWTRVVQRAHLSRIVAIPQMDVTFPGLVTDVAPLAGAWIETGERIDNLRSSSYRALYGKY